MASNGCEDEGEKGTPGTEACTGRTIGVVYKDQESGYGDLGSNGDAAQHSPLCFLSPF